VTNGPVINTPWWVQAIAIVGLPGVLALLLVGDRLDLIPGVHSQAYQARQDLARMELILRENQSLMRWTCHALWVQSGNERLAKVCWQRLQGDGRSDRDEGD
jgi:hypothetical protein